MFKLNQTLFFKNFRNLFFIAAVFCCHTVSAKDYYVSSSGNNANNGLTAATAWQTIAKVNSFSFAANDNVYFQRGNTFYGGIIVKRSNINYGAYGTGANPIISGLSTVTGWVSLGGNIWEAPVSNVKTGVNLVLRNSTPQQVGRYPNVDAADGGYLTFTASSATSVTGSAQSSQTNWTGAEVAIKVNRWSISRQKVTAHSGGTVSFAKNPDVPRLNYGYFFQRDSRTLDRDGEWWHNVASKKLRMYFSSNNPTSYTIQISTVDTLFKCANYSSVTINGLAFNGSGKRAIFVQGGSNMSIKNCSIANSGAEAITGKSTLNTTIDNCTITNSLGSGINMVNASGGTINYLVQNCTIVNTAYMAGMETSNESNGGEGIKCVGGTGIRVQNNSITNSGYNGIKWQGNNVYIKYNLVNRFCVLRDDGAGIYSWEDASRPETRFNRNIVSNIVLNGIGSNQGTNDNSTSVQGLYFDLGSKTVIADSNTVAYVASGAFHGNNCASLTFRANVLFQNARSYSFQRFAGADLIRNITIKKNIVYPYLFRYRNLGINSPSITKESDIKALGTIDSNYYASKDGKDTSLTTVTTYANNSNYDEAYMAFTYLTGTVGVEKHTTKFANNGTLEYNASNSPKTVTFSGSSRKDVYGNVYNNSVVIPAWSSKILLPNGTTTGGNKAPVANAGTALSIILPITTVTLTGKGTDADGTIAKYSWAKISGPSSGSIVSPLAATTVLLTLASGTYQFQLTVTDNSGATGKDTVQVTVGASGQNLHAAVNPANTVNGLNYKYYQGTWTSVPNFSSLTPVKSGTVTNFSLSPATRTTNYGFSFTGYIKVPADGIYTFYVSDDDGSNLLIDNVMVAANGTASGTIGLKAGKHLLTAAYYQQTGTAAFAVSYSGPGVTKQAVPASALYRTTSTGARVADGKALVDGVQVDEVESESSLNINSYPNPTTTDFGLSVEGGNNEKLAITVTDIDGRTVYQATGVSNKVYRFGNDFMRGVYIVKVLQGTTSKVLKVIKL